jgi:photosystem II stability/assembly factor-like uncharacterized protein
MTMRSVLFLLILAFLAPEVSGQGSWEVLPNAPVARSRHDDIYFVDAETGWLVNVPGQIWKTTDGGETWIQQLETAGAVNFRSVGFADHQVGWAGTVQTPGAVLFETRDGGTTWADITDRIVGPKPSGICGISIVNDKVAFGVGAFFGDPKLIRTVDGGNVWGGFDLSSRIATLIDVHFFDENVGLAVGGSGADFDGDAVILRTTNGGLTWQQVFRTTRQEGVTGEWGWKITFPTRTTGYVSVEYEVQSATRPAKVLKTEDAGLTWTEILIPGSLQRASLQGIGFVTPLIGWASGRGTTSLTVDGGQTWEQLEDYSPLNPEGQLDGNTNRIFVLADTLAYAVGRRVYKYDTGTTPTKVEGEVTSSPTFTLEQNYPNPFNPSTTIRYSLRAAADVRIRVIDLVGRELRTLVDAIQSPGRYEVTWDGRDAAGRRVASGTYLYLLDAADSPEMKRMVLIN